MGGGGGGVGGRDGKAPVREVRWEGAVGWEGEVFCVVVVDVGAGEVGCGVSGYALVKGGFFGGFAYPIPRMSFFSWGIGQPLISPVMGVKVGHSPFGQLTAVMTVSRTMGKLRYSGPDRVERATAHLRTAVSFIVTLQERLPLPVSVVVLE